MATRVGAILAAAISSSVANDEGRSELTENIAELIAVVSRRVRQLYTMAAMPQRFGGMGNGYYFAVNETVVVGASPVALAAAAAFRHSIVDALGVRVSVVSQADLDDQVAEMPPAVLIEKGLLRSAGRTGDPIVGASLTVRYTPLPGVLSVETDYVGASTPADPATTSWPDQVGDPYLISWLSRYLAVKSGDRDPQEMGQIQSDLGENAGLLGVLLGVDATRLSDAEEHA